MKSHKIRIETIISQKGTEDITKGTCPLRRDTSICRVNEIQCELGLTEIRVPMRCPLRIEKITENITVTLINELEE